MDKVGIVGCGHFGYAIALLLTRTHPELEVCTTDVSSEIIEGLKEKQKHPYFHTEYEAPDNLYPVKKAERVVKDADLVIIAVPAQYVRGAAESIQEYIDEETPVMNVAKALEEKTDLRMSQVIKQVLGEEQVVATLSGGMLADDVAAGTPVGAEIGCPDEETLGELRELFLPTTVHVETTTDIAGVEYSGSFKNVIAIGAGIIDGLDYGTSTKAFFISQALREVEELAVEMGAHQDTFHTASHAWVGDLLTTCFGNSRNRLFGELRGGGLSKEDAVAELEKEKKHAEGLATLHVVKELMEEHEIKSPFMDLLYRVVHEGADPEGFSNISLFQLDKEE